MIYSEYLSNQVLPNQSNKRITQNFFHRHVILNKQSSSPPLTHDLSIQTIVQKLR